MNIAILLINLLPGLLSSIPGISTKLKQIITDVSGAVSALVGSGALTQPNVSTILSAWLGIVTALKADPGLPANTLNAVLQLEKAISAALLNDVQAAALVDWTKIVVVATV